MSALEQTIALAARIHAGQRDKAGEPYIVHPLRVMLGMSTGVPHQLLPPHDDTPGISKHAPLKQEREQHPDNRVRGA